MYELDRMFWGNVLFKSRTADSWTSEWASRTADWSPEQEYRDFEGSFLKWNAECCVYPVPVSCVAFFDEASVLFLVVEVGGEPPQDQRQDTDEEDTEQEPHSDGHRRDGLGADGLSLNAHSALPSRSETVDEFHLAALVVLVWTVSLGRLLHCVSQTTYWKRTEKMTN